MKICQVLSSRGAGGLERHFIDLCNALAERHELVAVAHPEFRERLHARVIFEPLDLSGWRRNPIALARLYARLRAHCPDIVHAQANKAAAMLAALRPLLRARRVATVHNLKRDTRMYRGYDALIAVSAQLAAQLAGRAVEVIQNGIDPATVCASPDRGSELRERIGGRAGPLCIAVGRLVPAKGFDLLLRAWGEIDAPLFIVGEGPERARLEGLIRELGLGARVRLLGYRRDVPALLAAADLMVIASRNEGFPYVMVEGLHARRVIVATRAPGAADILPPRFLVDYGDAPALTATIAAVLKDPGTARAAYEPVWQYAARELTLAQMVQKTERVYAALVATR